MEENNQQGDANSSTHNNISHNKEVDEWSNIKCVRLALTDYFPSVVKDTNEQKNIINRFFNFYIGGKPQKGLNVTDLVFSTIAIMPMHVHTEKFIWEPRHYRENGTLFFMTPEDKLIAELNNLKHVTKGHDVDNTIEETQNCEDNNENVDESDESSAQEDKEDIVGEREDFEIRNSHEEKNDSINIEDNEQTTYVENEQENANEESHSDLPKLSTEIRWYGNKRYATKAENLRLKYEAKENSAFIRSCTKLLEEWDTNTKARIVLKYFFGIVALISMRACTKTYMHLVNTFATQKFLDSISFIIGYLNYTAPLKRYVKSCYRTFNKKDGKIPVMFAKIVVNSFYIDKMRREDGYNDMKINIFKQTLLAHTAGFGFGLVTMLQTFSNLNLVIAATYCEETAESWKNMKNFLDKYMARTSEEKTHHWARVIDSNYFKDLSCSSNYALSVVLAVFIENENKSPGIWQSTWLKHGENCETYKKLGIAMYKKYVKAQFVKLELFRKKICEELEKIDFSHYLPV